MSYLSKGEQASLRKRLQSAYNRPEYKEALAALDQLHDELEERNQSAAGSLEEGIEETLTLHRLGVYGVLGRSFKTTNCLESVNALGRGTLREGRPLEELQPTPAVAGDSPRGHRTPLEEGDRLPPSSEASRSSQAGTEDRDEDINGVEEEGRLIYEPWRVSTKNGLDSPESRVDTTISGTNRSSWLVSLSMSWVTRRRCSRVSSRRQRTGPHYLHESS